MQSKLVLVWLGELEIDRSNRVDCFRLMLEIKLVTHQLDLEVGKARTSIHEPAQRVRLPISWSVSTKRDETKQIETKRIWNETSYIISNDR